MPSPSAHSLKGSHTTTCSLHGKRFSCASHFKKPIIKPCKGKNKKKKLFILPLQGFLFIVCPAFVAYHQSPPLAGQAARYDTLQPECVL